MWDSVVDVYLGDTVAGDGPVFNKSIPATSTMAAAMSWMIWLREGIFLEAYNGTDCYSARPQKSIKLQEYPMRFSIMRNAYQNYNVGVNSPIVPSTPTWEFKAAFGNANYSTSGQLSPLFNDPYYRTIGLGTKSSWRRSGLC